MENSYMLRFFVIRFGRLTGTLDSRRHTYAPTVTDINSKQGFIKDLENGLITREHLLLFQCMEPFGIGNGQAVIPVAYRTQKMVIHKPSDVYWQIPPDLPGYIPPKPLCSKCKGSRKTGRL